MFYFLLKKEFILDLRKSAIDSSKIYFIGWTEEAEAVIQDVKDHVKKIQLSQKLKVSLYF